MLSEYIALCLQAFLHAGSSDLKLDILYFACFKKNLELVTKNGIIELGYEN